MLPAVGLVQVVEPEAQEQGQEAGEVGPERERVLGIATDRRGSARSLRQVCSEVGEAVGEGGLLPKRASSEGAEPDSGPRIPGEAPRSPGTLVPHEGRFTRNSGSA